MPVEATTSYGKIWADGDYCWHKGHWGICRVAATEQTVREERGTIKPGTAREIPRARFRAKLAAHGVDA